MVTFFDLFLTVNQGICTGNTSNGGSLQAAPFSLGAYWAQIPRVHGFALHSVTQI